MDKRELDALIEARYPALPPVLQRAARYAIENPRRLALDSMRRVAEAAGVQPSAMNRLARYLGFEGYGAFRSIYRTWIARGTGTFSQRATALQRLRAGSETQRLIGQLLHADMDNLSHIGDPEAVLSVVKACDVLAAAPRLYVAGLRSLFPAAFHFHYASRMFLRNTTLLTATGGVFADGLRHASPGDALLVFSCHPYARETVAAVEFAAAQGLRIVSVTDSPVSPVVAPSAVSILIRNTTASLFPSVVPALFIAQTLVALLLSNGGEASLREVEKSEAQLQTFAMYTQES